MSQVRVNLTLEKEIWEEFGKLVPNRKKSKIINELIRDEVNKRNKKRKEKELSQAFRDASTDEGRTREVCEWSSIDIEGWE
jgi:metal-responsive CopG/Arc/MetJ family transcriptional regulator